MKKAKIADLKNRLSHYLRFVRAGESVLVYDREQPIARIEPVSDARLHAGDPDWTDELERSGALRAPTAKLRPQWLKHRPRNKASVVRTLIEDRGSSR